MISQFYFSKVNQIIKKYSLIGSTIYVSFCKLHSMWVQFLMITKIKMIDIFYSSKYVEVWF